LGTVSEDESYYNRNKDTRKAYQKAYYEANKERMRRKKELDSVLQPEKLKKVQDYQRQYYLKNRQKLLEKRRHRYQTEQKGDS